MVDGGGLFSDRFDVGRDLVSLVLTANNLPRLDFIAVTHPDRDHLKGLLFIAANYAMKAAYTAPLEASTRRNMTRPGLSPKRSPPSLPRAEFPVILWARETCSPLRTGWRLRCWPRLPA